MGAAHLGSGILSAFNQQLIRANQQVIVRQTAQPPGFFSCSYAYKDCSYDMNIDLAVLQQFLQIQLDVDLKCLQTTAALLASPLVFVTESIASSIASYIASNQKILSLLCTSKIATETAFTVNLIVVAPILSTATIQSEGSSCSEFPTIILLLV